MLDTFEFEGEKRENEVLKTIVEKTFKGFELLIDKSKNHNNFIECLNNLDIQDRNRNNTYAELFIDAVNETLYTRPKVIDDIKELPIEKLTMVGLSQRSLQLKVRLFKDKLDELRKVIGGYANFKEPNVIKAFLKELTELKNILNSLKMAVPALEPLIELVKVLISFLEQLNQK